jgi:hypothetical protein
VKADGTKRNLRLFSGITEQRHGTAGANQSYISAAMLKHFVAVVTKHDCLQEEVRVGHSTEVPAVSQLGSNYTSYVK